MQMCGIRVCVLSRWYIPDVMLNKPCAFVLPLCVALTCRSGLHIGEGFVQLGDTCPDLTELFLEVSHCIGPGGYTHLSHITCHIQALTSATTIAKHTGASQQRHNTTVEYKIVWDSSLFPDIVCLK